MSTVTRLGVIISDTDPGGIGVWLSTSTTGECIVWARVDETKPWTRVTAPGCHLVPSSAPLAADAVFASGFGPVLVSPKGVRYRLTLDAGGQPTGLLLP